jgi:homoserine O-acetyltransferase
MEKKIYKHKQNFTLESGKIIENLEIAYHTFGRLNAKKDNVIWVCHSLTANSDVSDWWSDMFGEGKFFNPEEHYVVCANILGSHYGTTCPLSNNPNTGEPYYYDFPFFTIRDVANVHDILRKHLLLDEINLLIGGSVGGQQCLEWACMYPDKIKNLCLIATNARMSPWGIAFNETQRMAIENSPDWKLKHDEAGVEGLKTARALALLSYRNYQTYCDTQQNKDNEQLEHFRACSYQRYQGDKLAFRFNAFTYWYLTKAMDSHNVGRGRKSCQEALKSITAKTLVIGIDSDVLFPVSEHEFLANHIPNSKLKIMKSKYGHDGFLIEFEQLNKLLKKHFDC